jgi:lipoyl(octanoyl) transferase
MKIIYKQRCDYTPEWEAMKQFTIDRNVQTEDQLWLLEHHPVYTQGLAGKPEHVLNPHDIPVMHTDRGGQVTYHGPGQLMAYTLFDLERLGLNTRCFVAALEKTVIDLLADYNIESYGKRDAPGVYVDDAKICSIGLRVKRNCAYHGIALNVNMDLAPFNNINPCGFAKLPMTQIADFVPDISIDEIKEKISQKFVSHFSGVISPQACN